MEDKGTPFLRNELKSMICVKSNKYELYDIFLRWNMHAF